MNYCLLILTVTAFRCLAAPFALDVTVVDEDGTPVPGAAVWVDATPQLSQDPWNAPAKRQRIEATADSQGRTRLTGEHALTTFCPMAVCPGFYPAGALVKASSSSIRIVLPRRLGSSGSSQMEILTRSLPDDGAEHAFDLVMGAFVKPLGVGQQADIWIRGRCPSAGMKPGASGAYVDEASARFSAQGDGVVATPRRGEAGFDLSISPACAGMIFGELVAPRLAPSSGYLPTLVYRSARGPLASDIPGPGRAKQPQWILQIHRDGRVLHGLIDDFGWLPDGRLRLLYRISTEPGNRSLEFGP